MAEQTTELLSHIPATRRRVILRIAAYAVRTAKRTRAKIFSLLHIDQYIKLYYRALADEDLRERNTETLAKAALGQLQFAATRNNKTPKVRLYNPESARDGWTSPYSMVEIVCDAMPFLLTSISMVFARANINVQMVVHPTLHVQRDRQGRLRKLLDTKARPHTAHEAWFRFEIDRVTDHALLQSLQQQILATLADIRLASTDWQRMLQRAQQAGEQLHTHARSTAELRESSDFVHWLLERNFIFLGSQAFQLQRHRNKDTLKALPNTALGILRRSGSKQAHTVSLTGALRQYARQPTPILVTKSGSLSLVHRAAYLDHISIKHFDHTGQVSGETRFLGLFTAAVYSARPQDIPLLRHKAVHLITRLQLDPDSHDGKAALHVLEQLPRDELFQLSAHDLIRYVRDIVNLYERRRVRVFLRRDPFERYYSCLLYLPRDRYNTDVRERIETLLLGALHGAEVKAQVLLSDSTLVRLHLLIRTVQSARPVPTEAALEQHITNLIHTWTDQLREQLNAHFGETTARFLSKRYEAIFPAAYQADCSPAVALKDIEQLQTLEANKGDMTLSFESVTKARMRLHVLRCDTPLVLSDVLPLLENMGFRVLSERPYPLQQIPLQQSTTRTFWVQNFDLELTEPAAKTAAHDTALFHDAFYAIWHAHTENDGFNRLILLAGLNWRQAAVMRAYCRYLLQTGVPFSQVYMEQVLAKHARITTQLCALFNAQFDPQLTRTQRARTTKQWQQKTIRALETITNPDEDRILRTYLNAITASLRTNYFQTDAAGHNKSYLSIKFNSAHIAHLPLPKPLFEIFVHSPRFEGIHLRTGHVARGGLRWSDRREDFRTEVLGLMKAQTVKNSVIIPVGAKGGFVPKRIPPHASRDEIQREGIACYQNFIRGLLDLTDNIIEGKTIAPPQLVRRDADDPYLVVAADKGTATFSDIANRIAAEYQFWLGDAFASGGSAGYDHKVMAITARGAWVCVQRHFRELNINVQKQSFTAMGIGDMSGDVFGNGMLRSPHMKLQAAFNHQHIFLDPNPDPKISFKERQRLFALPRSSWEDYNPRLISAGGGIFSRSAKSIQLSATALALLGIDTPTLTPQDLIKAILCMPVDLFWNGGIGTYVKACSETHAEIGDRSNDAVRVNAKELRCKVVGEGGNLGFSQRGRIEYALLGGRINTDFIDNSGGVDCSDHEVNIKILLSHTARNQPGTERKRLLKHMTHAVADLVLRDNYLQSQAISVTESVAAERLQEHAHFIRTLELNHEIDRALECLPTVEEIAERQQAKQGLTRPELATLLSYSKLAFYKRLITSDVAEDKYLSQELARYFPPILQQRYGKLLPQHRLRREIIATATTNSLVNRMGPSFTLRVQADTGANAATIARAYTIAREAFDMRTLWSHIESLDNRIATALQYTMINDSSRLLRFVTYWLIRHHATTLDIQQKVSQLKPGLAALRHLLPNLLTADAFAHHVQQRDRLLQARVPENLATAIATLEPLCAGPDMVMLALNKQCPIATVAAIYCDLGAQLSLDWLRIQIAQLSVADHWQAVARNTLRDQLYDLQRTLCQHILTSAGRKKVTHATATTWFKKHHVTITKLKQNMQEIRALHHTDFATLSVALQSVRNLAMR